VLSALVEVARGAGDTAELGLLLERLLPHLEPTREGAARVRALVRLAQVRRARGDLDGAAAALEEAAVLAPDDLDTLEALGVLHEERHAPGAARAAFRACARRLNVDRAAAPRRARLALTLGGLAEAQGHVREAVGFYRRGSTRGCPEADADRA